MVQAELAHVLVEEGLPTDEAIHVADVIGRHRDVLLNLKVLKQFGVAVEETGGSALQGAIVMGTAFALGALAPILPYVLLPVGIATYVSSIATGAVLFAIGVVKTRWTHGSRLWSGLEILLIGALAGVVGYLVGTVLPRIPRRPGGRLVLAGCPLTGTTAS